MIKRIALGTGGILILLIGIILVRTFNYGGAPQDVREIVLPEVPDFDAGIAAQHLSEAIQFRTMTVDRKSTCLNSSHVKRFCIASPALHKKITKGRVSQNRKYLGFVENRF